MGRLAGFLRRLGAYLTDNLCILIYAACLAAITIAVFPNAEFSKIQGYGLALATLTIPTILTFAFLEAGTSASPGKFIWGLRVRSCDARPPLGQALLRNGIKFLPWELAHIGIWLMPGQPFVTAPEGLSVILIAVSYACLIIQAALVLAFGRGVHDWVAGVRVARR